ncbi:hypothetical protein [Tropicibacter naphthalenivorans]|uniref:Uncharacterized protein n=1 Tax=Tropicibacter naphthalenivorans TaxID=441103 RepID=A0A0P1GYW9_9RHOB|nr:hypothetical protein [Tropicibacter naphthalenivorans]CUH82610.1 hypothetical protein TRN7648_04152 [Tropicibacter naphthalenivorans]SMD08835.1 hypothetical protein SAMN04488093_1181 [Tropicibacter naphthalenivorans]
MITPIARSVVGSPMLQNLDLKTEIKHQRATGTLPGMLSFWERSMLHALAARTWRGDGTIIDGGSFFGSSLVATASGLRANPVTAGVDMTRFPGGKPVHGYELGFLPAPGSDKVDPHREFGGVKYKLGDSFVPILQDNIAPYNDLIDLHIGDLNEERWDGSPIEIAFIDVCKTARLNAHVSTQFYPAMIPGNSTLINQDFFFDRLPWVKVTMGYLKDYYRWEGQVFTSSIYSSVKAVPQDVADYDPYTEASYEECLAYHDAVEFPGIERKWQFFLALSRGYLMALKHRKDDALGHLRAVQDDYADILGDLEENPRGNQFRLDRAVRQISNGNIFKVS